MPKKINVAIIGLGFGAEFIPIYQKHPNARVHAICQRNADKMNKIGDQLKIERRYTKFEDVLKDKEVDFVHINSPIPDHGWMSIAALRAGKHVMCTVPMSTSIEECWQIADLVKQLGDDSYVKREEASRVQTVLGIGGRGDAGDDRATGRRPHGSGGSRRGVRGPGGTRRGTDRGRR